MREKGHWETDWIAISSEEAKAKPVCLLSVMLWKRSHQTNSVSSRVMQDPGDPGQLVM